MFPSWLVFCVAVLVVVSCIEFVLYWNRLKTQFVQNRMLRRAKEEVRDILQLPLNNPYPLIQISKSGQILFANPAALNLFPTIQSEGFFHPVLQDIEGSMSREIFYEDSVYLQTVLDGEMSGEEAFIIYCYDITERKESEEKLEIAYKDMEFSRMAAEHAKEARGEFLANMSHELRTPMNGIIGLSDMLVDVGLKGEQQDMIEAVNSSAKNLLILLNDILDFSKIEAGELSIENIPFDVRKIIDQIESLQKPIACKKGINLSTDIESEVPQYLIGDPSRLQQILNNLIGNALKFTEEGSVSLCVSGDYQSEDMFALKIFVEDTGIGIPIDRQDKIFEKFQQADSSTARKYGGTGLGLSITKDLAELMGGSISVRSQEGAGTVFTISIVMPICHEKFEEVAQDGVKSLGGVDLQARLLIVDDHPINLMFMRKVIGTMGFVNFDEVSSGAQALSFFQKNRYDLILMDCQMPDMDGFETAKKIRSLEGDVRTTIIAVTADAMRGAADKCFSAGMDDYISKPVDKYKLFTLLQKYVPGDNQCFQNIEEPRIKESVSSSVSIFNWQRLDDFTDGDPQAESELINIFIDNLNNDIGHLKESFRDQDYESWDEWVHKIYGACSHIGADIMADLCDQGQGLFPDDVDKIPQMHKSILKAYKNVCDALQSRKAA